MLFDDWSDVDLNDHRSDDAKAFSLPVQFQGPTYFRFDAAQPNSVPYSVALFLQYGDVFRNPSALLAVATGDLAEHVRLNKEELQNYAGNVLDAADAGSKLHLTIEAEAPSNSMAKVQVLAALPPEHLKRLVGALLDAHDALEVYERTGHFPFRHAHL